ncbi:MAG TPA: hypothetical protein VMF69_28960 [Gemmataceae bacterium]|nr:hypothetical protein [Gemmataceae bacterium]
MATGFGLANRFRPKAIAVETISNSPDEDAPRRIAPLAPVLFRKDSDEAASIQRVLRSPQPGPRNLPYCLHLIRLYGWGSIPGPHFTNGREVLAALTDLASSERYFGEPAFFQTRSGIRYRTLDVATASGAENHRDVCLATFAEAGLPLSTEFTTPKETFHLRDLLRDSVQNFHLQQKELPWTAIAYALYPSVGSRWTNRFGESFGWDELTEALLTAPFERNSCGGTHLLYALMLIRRTDRPLSTSVRAKLEERLKAAITSAIARQAADGHWPADWWADAPSKPVGDNRKIDDSNFTRLLITGHLLECLTFAPPGLQTPPEVYRRAARWLCRVLPDDRIDSKVSICPRTHAVCAVRNLVEANRNEVANRLPGPENVAGDVRLL